jgi:hypothetical protein
VICNHETAQHGKHASHVARAETCIINGSKHAAARRFNQLANDRVVKVVDVSPRNALANIVVLLLLQCQLDEQLLQLLVAVVDEKLLKSVVLGE